VHTLVIAPFSRKPTPEALRYGVHCKSFRSRSWSSFYRPRGGGKLSRHIYCCRPVFWPILQTLLACRFGAHVSCLLVVFRVAGRCPDYWDVSLTSAPIVLSSANFTSASARLTSVWIVWIPDRQRRYDHARELAVWSVQDSHFTFEKRWSKTYCSFILQYMLLRYC